MAINGSIPPDHTGRGIKKRRPSNCLSNDPFSNGISFSKTETPFAAIPVYSSNR